MRSRGQFQECPVLAQQELFLLGELVVLATVGIGCQSHAIGFVVGEARDIIDAVGKRPRPFMRRILFDQIHATARDGPTPVRGIFLELGYFVTSIW